MIMVPKQKVASLIVERMGSKDPGASNAKAFDERAKEPEARISDGERAAGEDLLSAFHAKDVESLVEAFKALMEVAEQGDSEPEETESDPSSFTE